MSTAYKVAVTCTLSLPYGRTSCDYIGDVTILSRFYDPSNEDSYQAGHSLSFSLWSESSLSAWRNLGSLATHREIPRSFSAKSRGVSPQNVAEFLHELSRSFSAKFRGEKPRRNNSFLFFSAKKINISREGCFAAKSEKRAFFLGWSVHVLENISLTPPIHQQTHYWSQCFESLICIHRTTQSNSFWTGNTARKRAENI